MVIVNGVSYEGNDLSMRNGRIFIDGVEQTPKEKTAEISIVIEGNINSLSCDVAKGIIVNGNVGEVKTMSGDVKVNGNVEGDVETLSGDVRASLISGKVKTLSGDIIQKIIC